MIQGTIRWRDSDWFPWFTESAIPGVQKLLQNTDIGEESSGF
jgi:hypothetical protein